ncbi:MAG: CBS domain-containing protein [Desulfurococcales archaeon]|nr:CBS domain-containing protein [Desulfurococcales archaeon]
MLRIFQYDGPTLFTLMQKIDIVSLPPDATVEDAIKAMAEANIGSILVVEEGKLVGIFTERDLLVKVSAKGLDPSKVKLREVMTANPIAAKPDWTAAEALEVMAYYGFRHLPVVDDDGRVVGIVSIKDVCRALTQTIDVDELHTAD